MKKGLLLISFLLLCTATMTFAQPSPQKIKAARTNAVSMNDSKFKESVADGALRTMPRTASGNVFTIPFVEKFQDPAFVEENFTFVDANGDGHDNINMWYWKEDEKLIQYNSDPNVVGDDWLFTPGIQFETTHRYKLTFSVNMGSSSCLKVTIGKTPDPKDHTEVLLDLNNIWDSWATAYDVMFDVPEDGVYYIGFQNYSTDCFYFNFFEMSIEAKDPYVPGTVFELPYYDNFEDGDKAKQAYTYIDVDGDGHDNLNTWFWKEDEKLIQFCSDNVNEGNDWFITPPIHMDGKNLYDLKFTLNMGMPSNVKVMLGTSTDPKDFTTEILDLNQINEQYRTEYNAKFRVPADGNYYLGFYCYSDVKSFYLNLFDILVEKGISGTYPDKVNVFDVKATDNGAIGATINFTAPETTIGGDKMPEVFDVDLYRNNKLVTTFAVTAGQEVTYEDVDVKAGANTYRLVVKIDDMESVPTEKTIWVGPDVSSPVGNFKAKTTEDNMHVVLKWEAPTEGANGGYFDINRVTYKVYRSYDGENFNILAEQLTDLTYTDTQIEEELADMQDSYFYVVTAVTDGGESVPQTALISVGKPYSIGNYESFENGQFNIMPWTTESIEGSFSWECIRKDKEGGGYAQDHDKGLIKFQNVWSDKADSRLKTPIFDLSGSNNPIFSFYMFHWEQNSIAADNNQTRCTIEISVDGGAFEPIAEPITAAYPEYGWFEHRISLAKYKDAKKVQFGLRGYTDNNWMYFYVDNIRIEEQYENDLAIAEFFATDYAKVNEIGSYTVRYQNRGTKTVSDYTVELYQDYELVASVKGEPIEPGQYITLDFNHPLTAAFADKEAEFNVAINYSADENIDNNESWELYTKIEGTWYPSVTNLEGSFGVGSDVKLKWSAPNIPADDEIVYDGFEEYLPFIIKDFGNWLSIDNDGRGSGTINELPDFTNNRKNKAFQVWAPMSINGFNQTKYPSLMPRTGDKCLIAWYANTSYAANDTPKNDDWLISPEVLGGSVVKMYVKRAYNDEKETYEILSSSSTVDIESFTLIESRVAGEEWELVEFVLPADARYFAIRYTAELQMGLMIDDIEYVSAVSDLKLQGYNVFRNGQKVNDELVTTESYQDFVYGDKLHFIYQVSAVYDRGESNACDAIYVNIPTGIKDASDSNVNVKAIDNGIIIESSVLNNAVIYTIDGSAVASVNVEGSAYVSLQSGIYIVKLGSASFKVIVR